MEASGLKDKITQGQTLIGSWVTLSDPSIVELMRLAGYDYCGIMMEHASLDYQTVASMIRAADAAGIPAIVRVPPHDEDAILRVMESGASGVMVPHVRSRKSALRVVQAVKYQPLGSRGMNAMTRAARWTTVDFGEHMRTSNQQSLVVVMVEDVEGIDNVADISSVAGVDVVFLGANDLSQAYGVAGESNSPIVRDVIERAAAVVNKIGKARLGLPIFHPAFYCGYKDLVGLGVRLITHSTDATVLVRAWKESLERARES